MIFALIPCTIATQSGYDAHGKQMLGQNQPIKCAVVKLANSVKKTSIRTDRSASQGNADEIIADARLLFNESVNPQVGDVITIRGIQLVVDVVEHKFNALSDKFDHYQVDLSIWQ